MRKIILFALTLVLIAACTTQNNNTNPDDNSQIANPASVFCIENGGILEIVTDGDGGQSGMCTLSDGTICEEWAYFRGECDSSNEHICTPSEISADVCTMEYAPVCGDDEITYGNGCSACASNNINSYVNGECKQEGNCGDCPLISKAGPDFCKGGKIIDGGVDSCGCQLPPKCSLVSEQIYCTEDAKECPDGSFVSRDPENNCEFKACNEEGIKTFCTTRTQVCTREYVPVCGWFNSDIKCIKYPCALTFSNKCEACADETVDYWTEGDCPE